MPCAGHDFTFKYDGSTYLLTPVDRAGDRTDLDVTDCSADDRGRFVLNV